MGAVVSTADPQGLRAHNLGVLLDQIWSAPDGTSRADLARSSGLSRSTVSAIVGELIQAGLVVETHVGLSRSGRPPIVLAFHEAAFGFVGIEMGASHVSAVLCDARGRVLFRRSEPWDVQGDPPGTLRLLHRFVAECVGSAGRRTVVGIGLAVPCPLDSLEPGLLSRRLLPAWAGVRVADELRARHGLAVFLDNDANLGALAEHWWGACRDVTCATYIKVATGVGAGHVIDGELFRGASGMAGEIGHTTVAVEGGHRCRCGLTGCLEAEIGSGAIVSRARERIAAGAASALLSAADLTLERVVSAARAGDPVACALIEEAGRHLGVAVANLLNLMNPAKVVLGGRLTTAGELLLVPLRRTLRDRALWSSIERTEVVFSELGEDHVAIGAATLVLDAALTRPRRFVGARTGTAVPLPATPDHAST
jgi:predicted NBD/HSP70 family sugar kinase